MSFKSDKQTATSSQTQTTTPWAMQTPYLSQAFQGAQTALNEAQGAKAPTDYTAQFTPQQLDAFQQMLNYGLSPSSSAAAAGAAGSQLTGAGTSAATGGLNTLSGINPASETANNITAANQYVAGQDIPSLVNAAMLDARRQANEQTLPSLARQAAGSGNINSSRTAIAQGIVDRGLAERAGALSAQLRGDAYDKGLALGQQSNNNALQAAMARVSGGNATAGTGLSAGNSAINQQTGLFNIANNAIANQYNAAQAPLTNEAQQYQAAINDPFAALVNYYNIIGNRPWGSSTVASGTATSEKTPSGLSSLIGGIGAIGSLIP